MDDMASLGMTVIAVIHQPRYSSFNLFDQVRDSPDLAQTRLPQYEESLSPVL